MEALCVKWMNNEDISLPFFVRISLWGKRGTGWFWLWKRRFEKAIDHIYVCESDDYLCVVSYDINDGNAAVGLPKGGFGDEVFAYLMWPFSHYSPYKAVRTFKHLNLFEHECEVYKKFIKQVRYHLANIMLKDLADGLA